MARQRSVYEILEDHELALRKVQATLTRLVPMASLTEWAIPQTGATGSGVLRAAADGTDNGWSLYWTGGPGDGSDGPGTLNIFGNSSDTLDVTMDGDLTVGTGLTVSAGGFDVTDQSTIEGDLRMQPAGGGVVKFFEAGPMGLSVYDTTDTYRYSSLYWRSSPKTWAFENGETGGKVLEIDPDVDATHSGGSGFSDPSITLNGNLNINNSFGDAGGQIYNVNTSGRHALVLGAQDGGTGGPLIALYTDDDTSYAGDVRMDMDGGTNVWTWDHSLSRMIFNQTIWAQASGINVMTTNASMFIGAHNGTSWGSKLQIQGQAGSNAYLRWLDEEVEKFRVDYSGNIHSTGTQWIAGGISNNTYLQQVEGSYLRWVENGSERFRVSNAGYTYTSGRRYYFGTGSNDYIEHSDASHYWTFVEDNVAIARVSRTGGTTIWGTDPYTTRQAWLTVHPAATGGSYDDQEGGITVGESGIRGSAAVHLVYTGDGYGHLGMGTVTLGNATPMAYRALRMKYNSSELYVQGGALYFPNMGTTSSYPQTLRQDTTSPYRVLRYSSTARMKTDIVDLGQEATKARGKPTVPSDRGRRQAEHVEAVAKWEANESGKSKGNKPPMDQLAFEEEVAAKHNVWLNPKQVIDPEDLMQLRPVSYLPSEEDHAGEQHRRRRNVGFIAEEFVNVFPSLVGFDDDGNPEGINYEALTALLVGMIQKQQVRIEALESSLSS